MKLGSVFFLLLLPLAGCDFQKKSPGLFEGIQVAPEAPKPLPSPIPPEAEQETPVIERVPVSPESMPESIPSVPPAVPPEQESGY